MLHNRQKLIRLYKKKEILQTCQQEPVQIDIVNHRQTTVVYDL